MLCGGFALLSRRKRDRVSADWCYVDRLPGRITPRLSLQLNDLALQLTNTVNQFPHRPRLLSGHDAQLLNVRRQLERRLDKRLALSLEGRLGLFSLHACKILCNPFDSLLGHAYPGSSATTLTLTPSGG